MLAVVGQAKTQAEAEPPSRERLHALETQTSSDLNANRTRIDPLRVEVRRLSQQSTEVFHEREAIGRSLAVAQERLRWVTDQASSLEAELAARSEADRALEARLAAARGEVVQREQAVVEAESQLRGLRGETSEGASQDVADLAPGGAPPPWGGAGRASASTGCMPTWRPAKRAWRRGVRVSRRRASNWTQPGSAWRGVTAPGKNKRIGGRRPKGRPRPRKKRA